MPVTNVLRPYTALMKDPTEYSSGINKLPLGKVDSRLLRCIINSGKGMALHDSTYSKTAATPLQGVTIDLNITSNAVTDKSGNGNHPTLSYVTMLNGEMRFDGVSSGVANITSSASYKTNSFTVFTKIKFNAGYGQVNPRLFDGVSAGVGGFIASIAASTGLLSFSIQASDGTYSTIASSSVLAINQTYDLAFVFENYAGSNLGRQSIYINGVLDNVMESVKVYAVGTSNLRIGNTSDGSRTLNGSIYAFKMFDHALSPAEVQALSTSGTNFPLLSGGQYFPLRKTIPISAGVGLTTNYQMSDLTVHYGAGTDSAGHAYLNSQCRTDFGDVRFKGINELSYWMKSKVNSDNAVFTVKVDADLSQNQNIYLYYGNPLATTTSNQAGTFIDVISNVVGAWNLEDAEADVNPTILWDNSTTAKWSDLTQVTLTKNGTHLQIVTPSSNSTGTMGGSGALVGAPDWSGKSRLKFNWTGANTAATISIYVYSISGANLFRYQFLDNFLGEKTITMPFSSFTVVSGSPVWTNIVSLYILGLPLNQTYLLNHLCIDNGVPALDSSGNGNNGTATGTTVVAGKFAGKNARQYNGVIGGDVIALPASSLFNNVTKFWASAVVKPLGAGGNGVDTILRKMDGGGSLGWTFKLNGTSTFTILAQKNYSGNPATSTSSTSFINSAFHHVLVTYDETGDRKPHLYLDGVEVSYSLSGPSTGSILDDSSVVQNIGNSYVGQQHVTFNGILGEIIQGSAIPTPANIANMANYYTDVTSQAGSVLVRQWASTTQPSWGISSDVQICRNFGDPLFIQV